MDKSTSSSGKAKKLRQGFWNKLRKLLLQNNASLSLINALENDIKEDNYLSLDDGRKIKMVFNNEVKSSLLLSVGKDRLSNVISENIDTAVLVQIIFLMARAGEDSEGRDLEMSKEELGQKLGYNDFIKACRIINDSEGKSD